MQYHSHYLDWYIKTPKQQYDLRSSGITSFIYNQQRAEFDFGVNYAHGNPKTTEVLAQRYAVPSENVFISSEGASGQNARIIRYLAEKNPQKNEAIVEYPTYEPLLRLVQEYFPYVKRVRRDEMEKYKLNANALRNVVSKKTGLLVMTNPHAPTVALANVQELEEIITVAQEYDFYILCDEIYAEFNRKRVPTLFSLDPERGIVTTSFTKAYGLGGLKLGITLAQKELVDDLYTDVLNTVGNSPNIVQHIAAELLTKGKTTLEHHQQKWTSMKKEIEKWLNEKNLNYHPNPISITYWIKTHLKDTYKWTINHAVPQYNLALVPGTFFLFNNDYQLVTSNMVRLGLGGLDPNRTKLRESLDVLEKALNY